MSYRAIIQEVHIKNFRSIVDETIKFDDFNIFVGLNDCGKSNVLKALNLFFNGETEVGQPLDFKRDYSQHGKTGKGKAKEIIVEISILIPEEFKEYGIKKWKKVWRDNELFSNNIGDLFNQYSKCVTLFNRIHFEYIPAVKSDDFFQNILLKLYYSMVGSADSALIKVNSTYSKTLAELTENLSNNVKAHVGIDSTIKMPDQMAMLFRNLKINTSDKDIKNIDINHRGDGIKARHIPSILLTIANNIKEARRKNSVDHTFIWGYEEPENGVEFFACSKLADELYSYCSSIQIMLTTHSPAIYSKNDSENVKCYYVYKDDHGNSKYDEDRSVVELNENIGLMPLIAPYIQDFQAQIDEHNERIKSLNNEIGRLNELAQQIVVYTEGETDTILLRKAFSVLEIDNLNLTIQSASTDSKQHSDSVVKNLLSLIKNNQEVSNKIIIGMFDRDSDTELPLMTGEKVKLNQSEYIKISKKLYAFALPVPHSRPEENQISIEHYFTDSEIMTYNEQGQRLFMGKEFYKNGNCIDETKNYNYINARNVFGTIKIIEHEQNATVTDRNGNGDFCLSKQRFAEAIRDDRPNFSGFDFSEYNKIFDVIKKIITEATGE